MVVISSPSPGQEARELARALLSVWGAQEYSITEYPNGAVVLDFPCHDVTTFTLE